MLEIKNLQKNFGRFSIRNLNLTVETNDYFILLGASGSGKSVLLEMIAGISNPDSGQIILNGKEITRTNIDKRRTGLLFQTPAIFPHLSVRQNIAYPLHNRSRSWISGRIGELAIQMNIQHLLDQKPAVLSGGELQRVALARTLASEPEILLLDEPLSAVDSNLKSDLRKLLRELNQNGLPMLHVTHDFEEAISLATAMAVIENGQINQSGNPETILANPGSSFAAGFAGERNYYPAVIRNNTALLENRKDPAQTAEIRLNDAFSDGPANILIRSRHVVVSVEEPQLSTTNNFHGIIHEITPSREGFEVCIRADIEIFARITRDSARKMNLAPGMYVWACFKASSVDVIRGL